MKLSTYAIIVIIILVAAIVGAYLGYNALTAPGKPVKVIKNGSEVSLYYYGYIIINGTPYIFATNMKSVANNNQTYLKAIDFRYPSSFSPLNFTVGSGQVIQGLNNGVIGMAPGETKIIVVPPSEGYSYNASLVHEIPRYGNISRIQNISISQFENKTGGVPKSGSVYFDKTFGWYDLVLNVNAITETVTYENDAYSGQTYYPYGNNVSWGYFVKYSNSSTIEYEIVTQINTYLPYGAYVSSITNSSIALNFNNYIAGKTLYFYVDIISVS
ncbi:MAG: FKBP-type peptidyl-prolyl cis-trans isomerase [Thermoplasmata archaeon]|nr:FKBP-type peptidyl-prolyl cis-trans isomerase [Thermoplasmata archaeon]